MKAYKTKHRYESIDGYYMGYGAVVRYKLGQQVDALGLAGGFVKAYKTKHKMMSKYYTAYERISFKTHYKYNLRRYNRDEPIIFSTNS